jgi:hypothetical protein
VSGSKEISQQARTEYLVLRRFPFARVLDLPTSLSNRPRLSGPTITPETRQALADYRAELAALSPSELIGRYEAEQKRNYNEIALKAEEEERQRFYNQPQAEANVVHWSKMAHWTLDEAVALSFGKAPERVNWPAISKYLNISKFAVEYAQRRELALRAAQWKQLTDPVMPGGFLAWAKRTDIDVPAELLEAIQKRGVQVADWKSLYDNAVEAHKQAIASAEASSAIWKEMYEKVFAALKKDHSEWLNLVDQKTTYIAALEAQIAEQSLPEQDVGTRARESLLKLLIGMAVGAYAYDHKAARSDRPAEIAADLERVGVPLDVDTVRKWLREAADLLPPKGTG